MNEVVPTVFENMTVRSILRDGKPWFVVADVCVILKIQRSGHTIDCLANDEKGCIKIPTLGGPQEMTVVSEGGLYTIMLRSNEAMVAGTSAYRFRRWVVDVLLPSVRATGTLLQPYDPFSPRGCVGTCHGPNGLEPYAIDASLDDSERERVAQEQAASSGVPVNVLRVMVQRLYEKDLRETLQAQLTQH